MKGKVNYIAIAIYYIIAITLRYLAVKTEIFNGASNNVFIQAMIRGMGPALGAVIVLYLFKIKPALSLKGNYRSIATPVMLYWVLPVVLIAGVSFISSGSFPIVNVCTILCYGLLEELGWRRFLYQELKPLHQFLNILIVTVLWFTWHLNFDLTGNNLLFFFILLLGSWGIGKVADKTHSLLAVAAFHSLNNFFGDYNAIKVLVLLILVVAWVSSLIIREKNKRLASKPNALFL